MRALAFLMLLAAPGDAETLHKGQIVERLASNVDPSVTYAYYLPESYTRERKWPLLFVFDPRSRGAMAAELFREAAEEFGWIIVSSNDTRSDGPMEPNVRAINGMWPDVHVRFAVDPNRIYATGFSGGAILAFALAETTNAVAGVISVGGRHHDVAQIGKISFDWFGTAGNTDFNYLETREIEDRLKSLDARWRFESFPGRHRWAPKELLRRSVEWMEVQAMQRRLRPVDESIVTSALASDAARATSEADVLAALDGWRSIVRTYRGLADVKSAERRIAELEASPAVRAARKDYERGLDLERRHRARLPSLLRDFLADEDPPPAAAIAQQFQIPILKRIARGEGYRAIAAQRVLETIFVQFNFYLQRQVSGPKLAVTRAVAQIIHPD